MDNVPNTPKIAIDIGNAFFGSNNSYLKSLTGIGKLVSSIVATAIAIAGLILIFLLIFGGISMIVGAGQQNPQKVAQGSKAATSALIGFAIIFTAYWIVRGIQFITGVPIL